MKAGTRLETDRLVLRHWQAGDIDVFHRLNHDDAVMHYFPFRRTRTQSAEMMALIGSLIDENGFGWAAICLKDTEEPIGFAGLSHVRFNVDFTPAVEIGWRLLPEYWGKGYASEAARALLTHGFTDLGLDEIVSFAVADNRASTAVMGRIGMRPEPDLDFDMPGIDDDFAHLRRHVFYRLSKADWEASR